MPSVTDGIVVVRAKPFLHTSLWEQNHRSDTKVLEFSVVSVFAVAILVETPILVG